jgi:trehalose-phosphatase
MVALAPTSVTRHPTEAMTHLPPSWTASEEASSLAERLRTAPRSLLMLDYDGTLAPFHVDRLQAVPYPGVIDRLTALSALPRVRLILVYGRSARELRQLLPPQIKAEIWGSHGREWLGRQDEYKLFALNSVQQEALDQFHREMKALALEHTLEVKPSSIAVHWRNADGGDQEKIHAAVESIFASLGEVNSLRLLPFDGGMELRTVDRTKGTAVGLIVEHEPGTTPLAYLGDDFTDEDAFLALGDRGHSILVKSAVRASNAHFWLQPPEELLVFLDHWIAAVSS